MVNEACWLGGCIGSTQVSSSYFTKSFVVYRLNHVLPQFKSIKQTNDVEIWCKKKKKKFSKEKHESSPATSPLIVVGLILHKSVHFNQNNSKFATLISQCCCSHCHLNETAISLMCEPYTALKWAACAEEVRRSALCLQKYKWMLLVLACV